MELKILRRPDGLYACCCPVCAHRLNCWLHYWRISYSRCGIVAPDAEGVAFGCDREMGHTGPHAECRVSIENTAEKAKAYSRHCACVEGNREPT